MKGALFLTGLGGLGLISLLSAAPCGAEPAAPAGEECTGTRPWVALAGGVRGTLAEAFRSELRAGLSPSHIDACPAEAGPASEPLARVTLTPVGDSGTRYSVDVIDSVTRKRVGRDLSLDELPADGRALALAVAAEELLRASWAELALRGPHSAQTAPPPEVRAVVEQAPPRPPSPRLSSAFGARVAFEHFLGGQTHYGADVFTALPLGAVGVTAALGGRRGLSQKAAHGSIDARALAAELGLAVCLACAPAFELSATVSGRALWLTYQPVAVPGAAASSASGLSLVSRAGLAFAFGRPSALRSYSALGAGFSLRSFSAADSGAEVTGVRSLELFASTGLAFELP